MSRIQAIQIFESAITAVQPLQLMQSHLYADAEHVQIAGNKIEKKAINKFIVIAAGKAAAAMAQQAELQLGEIITDGICITKYGHGLPLQKIKLLEAAHPVPDANSMVAAQQVLQLANSLTQHDILLVLISGGASSLITDVPGGCTLAEVQTTYDLLIKSGVSIHTMNAVRKHLSKIKGGQLAEAAQPAKVFSLILSDVVGDALDTIASGPTVPDSSSFEEVHELLLQYNLWNRIPKSVQHYFTNGLQKLIADTPKPGEAFFENTFTQIIGNNRIALHAAKEKALQLGYEAFIYQENVTDSAATFAKSFVRKGGSYQGNLPVCIIAGGETTVQVTGNGKGGRNQHLVLCALHELSKQPATRHKITILSGGTDGTDGPTDAAGAVADATLLTEANISPIKYIENCDAYHFFEQTGGLIKIGPTQTNVMDIMLLLIS
jgi:glycerate 2-kinase